MRKWKSLVSALLLTVLLIAVTAVDGTLLMTGSPDSQLTAPEIQCAAMARIPIIRLKLAVYDDEGNLSKCITGGNNCVVIVVANERRLMFAAGGVLLK